MACEETPAGEREIPEGAPQWSTTLHLVQPGMDTNWQFRFLCSQPSNDMNSTKQLCKIISLSY